MTTLSRTGLLILPLLFVFLAPLFALAATCTYDWQCPSGWACNPSTSQCQAGTNYGTGGTLSFGGAGGTLQSYGGFIISFVNSVIVPVIFAIAFVVFLWGVYTYFIAGAADEGKRKDGRTLILYGIIGFVIMLSVWGIVRLVQNTFGFGSETRPGLPLF